MRHLHIRPTLTRVVRTVLGYATIVALLLAIVHNAVRWHDVIQMNRAGKLHSTTRNERTAILVFQPMDCVESYDFLRHWENEATQRGLRLVGAPLVKKDRVEDAMAVMRRADLEFPLDVSVARAAERVGLIAGYRNTPFVLVFDKGRLREIHGPER